MKSLCYNAYTKYIYVKHEKCNAEKEKQAHMCVCDVYKI